MNKLKEIRFHRELSQIELQNRSGVHRTFISFFENGHLEPTENQKRKISKALKVRITDIWPEPLKGRTLLTRPETETGGS